MHERDNSTVSKKHGQRHTRLYRIWSNMIDRCYNPNATNFKNYGKRGVVMCDSWRKNFVNFFNWATGNGYSESLQIDRYDNDGIYEPNNCHWVTPSENCRNKRGNRFITIDGETKLLVEWAELVGIDLTSMIYRIKRRGLGEHCLLPPVQYRKFWLAEREVKHD